jgi:hypothetical protein
MNIIENNKLIAEFMGLEIITDGISWFDANFKPLENYDKSWSSLIPVIEKIASLSYRVLLEFDKNPELNDIYIQDIETGEYLQTDYEDRNYQIESNIHLVWFNVVNFINWYNKNK